MNRRRAHLIYKFSIALTFMLICTTFLLLRNGGTNEEIEIPVIPKVIKKRNPLLPTCEIAPTRFTLNASSASFLSPEELLSQGILDGMENDGFYYPEDCNPKEGPIALIIPFRGREEHLGITVPYLIQYLKWQKKEFQIFVVEQADKQPFNKGSISNVGFLEALKLQRGFSCFIFHDVDLLPETESPLIDYACGEKGPVHLSTAVKLGSKLDFSHIFGGVVCLTQKQFEKLNGYSNCYWGWGPEDGDLYLRTFAQEMTIQAPSFATGTYLGLEHEPELQNQGTSELLMKSDKRMAKDGLNSLGYKVNEVLEERSHTRIKVTLKNMDMKGCY